MTRDAIYKKIAEITAYQLNLKVGDTHPGRRFREDLGADSLDEIELVMSCEECFHLAIPDEDAEKINTVAEAVDYIAGRLV